MGEAALKVNTSARQARQKLTKEAFAELADDMEDMKREYNKKLLKLDDMHRERKERNRAIRAIKEQVTDLRAQISYINRKLQQ